MDYRTKLKQNKIKWLEIDSSLTEDSGIYVLRRKDENGIRYAYVGQAKHILTRLAEHLDGYQHIDLSLKKHGLHNTYTNPFGWQVWAKEFPIDKLDEMERKYIKDFADAGYQLRNKTIGGQNCGKDGLDGATKASKGYYDGLKQGYLNARREISKLFKDCLIVEINGNDGIRKQKALDKFNEFINIGGNEDETTKH